jgi:rare lipoprotein A
MKFLTAGLTIALSGLAIAQTPATATKPAAPAAAAPAPAAAPAAAPAPAAPTTAPAPAVAPVAARSSSTTDVMEGKAAWYGKRFAGRKTASGKIFNPAAMTAAHNTLAFGTKVKVTNTKNNKSVTVTITDRGPSTPGRIIDVSAAAAGKLGFVRAGTADVKLEITAEAPAKKVKVKKAATK